MYASIFIPDETKIRISRFNKRATVKKKYVGNISPAILRSYIFTSYMPIFNGRLRNLSPALRLSVLRSYSLPVVRVLHTNPQVLKNVNEWRKKKKKLPVKWRAGIHTPHFIF